MTPPWGKRTRDEDAERAARAREKAERDLARSQAQARRLEDVHERWRRIREHNHIAAAVIESWTGGNP